MKHLKVTVVSNQGDLLPSLRERCPFAQFSSTDSGQPERRVVILDSGAPIVPPMTAQEVRIILDPPDDATRRRNELRLPREVFVANPAEYLRFAQDLLAMIEHSDDLQQEVDLFSQIRDLISIGDAEPVYEKITRSALSVADLPHGSLLVYDSQLERFVTAYNDDPEFIESSEFLPPLLRDAVRQAVDEHHDYSITHRAGADIVTVPVQIREDLIGVFAARITSPDWDERLAARAARYLRSVTGVIAYMHHLSDTKDLAMRDDLTKAYNRRFFESYLDEEIERTRRYGSFFSIIFLDLDDLKNVNSKYGHLTGSRVLQEVAKRILNAVRGIDKVVRFGGDEFCIILPQTDQEQARLVAMRVRKSMGDVPLHVDRNLDLTITASFGIATYPFHGLTKEDLVRQADEAMFQVKTTTKNAIGVAGPGTSAATRSGDAG